MDALVLLVEARIHCCVSGQLFTACVALIASSPEVGNKNILSGEIKCS